MYEEELKDSATTPNEMPRYRHSTSSIDALRRPPLPPTFLVDDQVITGLRYRKLGCLRCACRAGIHEYVRERHPHKELTA